MDKYLYDTLFIIGAGAHVPYKMPTSFGLREEIKELYKCKVRFEIELPDPEIITILDKKKALYFLASLLNLAGNGPQKESDTISYFDAFLESFCESHVLSIDSYLSNLHKETDEHKRDIFGKLGKLTIAFLISEAEKSTFLGGRKDDWIHLFINQFIKKDHEKFFKSPPKIVTFNYDRIFERMIYTHLVEFHKLSFLVADTLVKSLDIFHVYGNLGTYTEWYEKHHRLQTIIDFYSTAISNITIIGDERAKKIESETIGQIRRRYNSTSNIYFLGYGFDEDNNRILTKSFSQDWYRDRKVYSTSINLKKSDLNRIKNNLQTTHMFELTAGNTKVVEKDCSYLISEESPLKLI